MINQTSSHSEKTVSSLPRILCSLFRSILYKKSAKDYPLKTKLNFVPLSNRPHMKNKSAIQSLELSIYTAIHNLKNNSNTNKDTRKMENIKNLLFGSQSNFQKLLTILKINYPKQDLNYLPDAQQTVREFFCQQYSKIMNVLWEQAQGNKELYKNKNQIKNPGKNKQQFQKSKKFIHWLFTEKHLKWDQNIERFCYKIINVQRQSEARQSETRQAEARQSETIQSEARQSETIQSESNHYQDQITERGEEIEEMVWSLKQQYFYYDRWWEYEKPIPIFQVLMNDSDTTISHQNEEDWFKEFCWPLRR